MTSFFVDADFLLRFSGFVAAMQRAGEPQIFCLHVITMTYSKTAQKKCLLQNEVPEPVRKHEFRVYR